MPVGFLHMESLRTFLSGTQRFAVAVPLVLRIVIGGVMTYHGYQKFDDGIEGAEMFFETVDAPAASVTAPLVAVVDLVAGIALILGAATRLAAIALGGVLVGALILVKTDIGVIGSMGEMPGAELDLALLAGLVVLVILGPGPVSVDRAAGIEPRSGLESPGVEPSHGVTSRS